MSWTTQPKVGAPATVEVTSDYFDQLLEPLNLPTGLVPIVLSTFSQYTIDVPTMCSAAPPPPETFTLDDFFRYIDAPTHDLMEAKLRRLITAAQWNTYCEFVATPAPGVGLSGNPMYVHDDTFGGGFGPYYNYQQLIGAPGRVFDGPPLRTDAQFWTVMIVKQAAYAGANPTLHLVDQDGANWDNTNWYGGWPISVGEFIVAIVRFDQLHTPVEGRDFHWRMSMPDGGEWSWNFSAWTLTPPDPPPPWPIGPVLPQGQFTPECIEALCAMAAAYPPTPTDLTGLADQLAAVLARLPTGRPPIQLGAPQFVFGNTTLTAPAGAAGAYMALIVPATHSKLATTPPIYIDAGWATPGTPGAWFEPHRLQHVDNLIYPLPPGATKIAYTLTPGNIGIHTWLAEAPPP